MAPSYGDLNKCYFGIWGESQFVPKLQIASIFFNCRISCILIPERYLQLELFLKADCVVCYDKSIKIEG
jgi:hypothetical protein